MLFVTVGCIMHTYECTIVYITLKEDKKNFFSNKKTKKKMIFDPDVIRTRSLLIWSQTRYHCATESVKTRSKRNKIDKTGL